MTPDDQANARYGQTAGNYYGTLALSNPTLANRLNIIRTHPNLKELLDVACLSSWFAARIAGMDHNNNLVSDAQCAAMLQSVLFDGGSPVVGLPNDVLARATTPPFIRSFLVAAF